MFFFFSSRRRHTRLTCDWSSDVCSSDLSRGEEGPVTIAGRRRGDGAQPLLSLRELHVNYDNIAAIKGLTIDVYPGEIVTLIGSNGAGKSTTLRTISGLLRPRR